MEEYSYKEIIFESLQKICSIVRPTILDLADELKIFLTSAPLGRPLTMIGRRNKSPLNHSYVWLDEK